MDHISSNPPPLLIFSMLDKLPVQCILCEKTDINRCHFDEHIKKTCPQYGMHCPGNSIGCSWFGSRNEWTDHLKTCVFNSLLPTIDRLDNTIQKQKSHFEDLRQQVEQQKIQIEKIREQQRIQLEKPSVDIQEQKIEIENIRSQHEHQYDELSSVRKQIIEFENEINGMKSRIDCQTKSTMAVNRLWIPNGVSVAGGNGSGYNTNQLDRPFGLFVDDDKTVVIADFGNHRIMQWKNNDTNGYVIAGGNGEGNQLNQLSCPTDVLIDDDTDSLIICDYHNRRVLQWSRHNNGAHSEILIDNIDCFGLAMDNQRYLYISDVAKHEVRRYQIGDTEGIVIAGGNDKGDGLNQLHCPGYLCVDKDQNVYVSDNRNHRVMKWNKEAKEGIVVAGGHGQGNSLKQLSYPNGIYVDTLGNIYVADLKNHRVICWTEGVEQGTVIVGGNGEGSCENQFDHPAALKFDRDGNLYVADKNNHRVQRFSFK